MEQAEIPVQVTIIGAPVACEEGIKDTWRDVAEWAAGQLKARFGDRVEVRYYDLFSSDCPPIPPGAQLPLVLVNGKVQSSGGKISVPVIRRLIEDSGVIIRMEKDKLRDTCTNRNVKG